MKETGKVTVNGYEYTTYEGGTTTARGFSQDIKASRNGMGKDIGGAYKLETDDRGHLIGAQHNGTAKEINLFAQDSSLNRGPYRTVENTEMGITRDSNNPGCVYMEKTSFSLNADENGSRPDVYMVNDTITYADGQSQHVNLSFANLGSKEQEMYGEEAAKYNIEADNPGDRLRESMSEEEYSELMESTEDSLPSIKDEYSMAIEHHYDYSAIQEATNQQLETTEFSSGWDNVMVYDMQDGGWVPSSDYGLSASSNNNMESDSMGVDTGDIGDMSDSCVDAGMSMVDE